MDSNNIRNIHIYRTNVRIHGDFLASRVFVIKLIYRILLKHQKYSRQRVLFRRLGSNLLPLTDLKDSSSPFIRRRGLKSVGARVSDMSHSQSKPGIRIRGIRARNGASRRRRFSKPGLAWNRARTERLRNF